MASEKYPTLPTEVLEAYSVAGIPAAAKDMDNLLRIVTTTAHRIIHFKPPAHPALSQDEMRYLTMLTAARCEGCDNKTLFLFREWLPATAARLALPHARRYVSATFAKYGSPTAPHCDAWRMDQQTQTRSPDAGLRLTH
jgi:hypothetical protein